MSLTRSLSLGILSGAVLAAAKVAGAQASESYGLTAASFTFEDGHREQGVAAVVQLAPAPWFLLGASPTVVRAEYADGSEPAIGFADLPVYAGLTHAFALPFRPTLGVAATASLPTGDAERGFGRGKAIVGAEGALAISPLPLLTLRAGGARLIEDNGLFPADAPRTSVFGDAVLTIGPRTNASVALASDLPPAGSQYERTRSASAAIVHALTGRTALLVGAGRRLEGYGPSWSVTIGVGSAFGGVAPIGAASTRARSVGGVRPPADGGSLTPSSGSNPLCGLTGC